MSHQLLQEEEITPRSALPYRPIHGKTSSDHGVGVPRASRQPRLSDTKPSTKTSLRSGSPRRAEYHKLFFVDIGMLLALAVVVLGHIALNWISVTEDDLHYGRPRTYQVDALIRAMTIIPIWWWCLGRVIWCFAMSRGRFVHRRPMRSGESEQCSHQGRSSCAPLRLLIVGPVFMEPSGSHLGIQAVIGLAR